MFKYDKFVITGINDSNRKEIVEIMEENDEKHLICENTKEVYVTLGGTHGRAIEDGWYKKNEEDPVYASWKGVPYVTAEELLVYNKKEEKNMSEWFYSVELYKNGRLMDKGSGAIESTKSGSKVMEDIEKKYRLYEDIVFVAFHRI